MCKRYDLNDHTVHCEQCGGDSTPVTVCWVDGKTVCGTCHGKRKHLTVAQFQTLAHRATTPRRAQA